MDWNSDLRARPVTELSGMPEQPGHGVRFKPEILKDCRTGGFEARA
jgi:hypothetical protein